jgi:outer membrane protein OmpA-like peptidoglycan-associated protein
MSATQPVASNETPTGRAENRRVVVKLLLNRGLSNQ